MNLSLPGNPRYQPKSLVIFGYDKLYRPVAEVEIAALEALAEIGVIPPEEFVLFTPEHRETLLGITTTEVDERERITKHDIRAWVQLAQERLPPRLRRWLHVPLTSYDALDTARVLLFLRAHKEVVVPQIEQLLVALVSKIKENLGALQIGRTHGQHALPITVAFWLATLASRVLSNLQQMNHCAHGLVGKISGAVGAFNAQVGLGISTKCGNHTFEERVLGRLGLKPARISTQILPPEPMAYYLFSVTMMSAALGQLGRDCRNLMRTEIGEVSEPFKKGQVGSSTMVHKRNPIMFENSEGMFEKNVGEFVKVLLTLISEHQRDLVGSPVARDFPIMVVNLVVQLGNLLRKGEGDKSFIERVRIDKEACARNAGMQSSVILAEPLYLALQMAGFEGDAHEVVNHGAMPLVTDGSVASLMEAVERLAESDEFLAVALRQIPKDVLLLLRDPAKYVGWADQKAKEVCDQVEAYLPRAK